MHPLLTRQLRKAVGEQYAEIERVPAPWRQFVELVGQAYEAADADAKLSESSMELASQELYERNSELTTINAQLQVLQQELRQSHEELEQRVKERTTQLQAALEQAKIASNAKSTFLANMSHEIRTPMTAIMGYADMLLAHHQDANEREQCVKIIHQQGEHLLSVLNDILDLSKIEANRIEVERLRCDPTKVIADAVSLMRVRAIQKKLTCDVKYLSPMPATIETDPTRLRQILLNLIGNAIKFTETGGIQISVSVVRSPTDENNMLQIEVADSGIGMTDQEMQGLFTPFGQADASMTRRFGGTGLGLSICKRLTQMLGGDVVVHSVRGCGSCFTATVSAGNLQNVPMVHHASEMSRDSVDEHHNTQRVALTGRVLLAEDGVLNQQVFRCFLESAGLQVTIVNNGRAACDQALAAAAQGTPFDVILLDMQMPEMDGYSAASLLREKAYAGPVIAVTAHAMAGDREKCFAKGCTDYLTKPINRATLIATVARYLPSTPAVPQEPPLCSLVDDPGIAQFLPAFIEELPSRVEELLNLQRQCDADGMARLLHALKGTSGMFGFPAIGERAAEIEEHLHQSASAISTIENEVQSLVSLIQRVDGYGSRVTLKR